jgi:hypothetical protein
MAAGLRRLVFRVGHRVVAEGSNHRIQDDPPDVVIAAIRQVIGTRVRR